MRFLALRDGIGRLGFRDRQAALLLRGNNVIEVWSGRAAASSVWTPNSADDETWDTTAIINDSDNTSAMAAWLED